MPYIMDNNLENIAVQFSPHKDESGKARARDCATLNSNPGPPRFTKLINVLRCAAEGRALNSGSPHIAMRVESS